MLTSFVFLPDRYIGITWAGTNKTNLWQARIQGRGRGEVTIGTYVSQKVKTDKTIGITINIISRALVLKRTQEYFRIFRFYIFIFVPKKKKCWCELPF